MQSGSEPGPVPAPGPPLHSAPVSGRSPARLLAPVALVATFLALFLLLSGGGGGGEEDAPVDSGGDQPGVSTPSKNSAGKATEKKTTSAKRYTVKAGDTPSSIAEEAGISLDRLLELNPDIDPQALSPGQKLKLE